MGHRRSDADRVQRGVPPWLPRWSVLRKKTNAPLTGFSEESLRTALHGERIRQAQISFNLTCFVVITGAAFAIAGGALVLSGKTPEGSVVTVGSFITNAIGVCCMRLTKDANDRLDKI